jgi:hypothetical protein
MAWRYVMDLDETLVAHAFATSSAFLSVERSRGTKLLLTGSIVVGIEHGKESAYDEHIGVLIESSHVAGVN